MSIQRKRYLVDRPIQLQIAGRVAIYWGAGMMFVILPLALIRTISGGLFANNILHVCSDYWPVFAMMLALLPFAIVDSIRFSNKFAGPIYRLRTDLKRYEEGEKIEPIRFREGDCYTDLPDSINALISKVDDLESMVAKELNTTNV